MTAIDDVKARLDIVEVISQYVPLAKSGRTFRALCPFHSEKSPSFYVYPETQSWHCFGACSTGGDAFAFVMKKEAIDFPEALRRLADRAGVVIPVSGERDGQREARQRLYHANDAAASYFHQLLKTSPAAERARAYLTKRGLSAVSLDAFQLGYALESWDALKKTLGERGFTEDELVEAGLQSVNEEGRRFDRWRNKIIFPIKDERGRTCGFGARVLDDSLPKYVNSPQTPVFDKSGSLYGAHLAAPAIRKQDAAVIVEGYMDAITAHQGGFANVVASMGTSITDKQINSLKKMSRNLVLALDSDSAGAEAMLRCVGYENTLEAEIRVVILPEGKDPDEVIKEDSKKWEALVAGARPVLDYTFETVTAGLDLTKARDKSRALERLLPLSAGITDIARRAHYFQKLARLTGVGDAELQAAARKPKAVTRSKAATAGAAAQAPPVYKPVNPLLASPLEEYTLALLLRHDELSEAGRMLPPEYFENSENREILLAWRECPDIAGLRDKLDESMRELLDGLLARDIVAVKIEAKYADCALRLKQAHLRRLKQRRQAFQSETDTASTFPQPEDNEIANELKKVFDQKARRA